MFKDLLSDSCLIVMEGFSVFAIGLVDIEHEMFKVWDEI
jgi:hypothetical protein